MPASLAKSYTLILLILYSQSFNVKTYLTVLNPEGPGQFLFLFEKNLWTNVIITTIG